MLLDLQQNRLVLLQIRGNLQQNNDPEGARILDGRLPLHRGDLAPVVLLQITVDLQQLNADLQQLNVNRQQNRAYLQHLLRHVLQIIEDGEPLSGCLQHLFLDSQHLRAHWQQKIRSLQHFPGSRRLRKGDLQHPWLRGKRGDLPVLLAKGKGKDTDHFRGAHVQRLLLLSATGGRGTIHVEPVVGPVREQLDLEMMIPVIPDHGEASGLQEGAVRRDECLPDPLAEGFPEAPDADRLGWIERSLGR
ncbi:MAG TPA: hypothetical protein VLT87_25945 [Thermoanaerobaculia bacterium]|nr:hypothetical protein [Thermoanaerobaculia bacterium]